MMMTYDSGNEAEEIRRLARNDNHAITEKCQVAEDQRTG